MGKEINVAYGYGKNKKRNMCFVTRVAISYKFINVNTVNKVQERS